ncbi:electron transfer flavoprotein subunit alpha/FixB family protein [Novosphingobium terrae]|uniref:electron transfer flavoprotein subunit alpha/FixB family protein n=1 Tax=Novosphingobium terrae TaxID=2726189 RepID=UPI00197E3224|nr:FAD-binding protein [Novosphingobium terrae]
MSTLLLAEHDNAVLSEQTARALTAALQIGAEVDVLVIGKAAQAVAEAAAHLQGIRKVLLAQSDDLEHHLAEPASALLLSLASGYTNIVAAATTTGKSILPRVAALLDVMQVSEIIAVVAPDTFKRPIYAGNAVQTVQSSDNTRVITVRTAGFAPAPHGNAAAPIEDIGASPASGLSAFKENRFAVSERPELASARLVVSGGRALGSEQSFRDTILPLADRLGAAVGASRAAVDAGYAPNDWQVGQTGKIIAPDLYVACGISGAIQHLAGMKDAKVIVAINKDPDAPIFQVADYGLVGDLFELVPAFEQQLSL